MMSPLRRLLLHSCEHLSLPGIENLGVQKAGNKVNSSSNRSKLLHSQSCNTLYLHKPESCYSLHTRLNAVVSIHFGKHIITGRSHLNGNGWTGKDQKNIIRTIWKNYWQKSRQGCSLSPLKLQQGEKQFPLYIITHPCISLQIMTI